jgi:hypothetical protein
MIIQDNVVKATIALANFAASGSIGTAATTVDLASSAVITQTTAAIALTLPTPTGTASEVTGLEFEAINALASTQSITVGSTLLVPGSVGIFRYDGAAWANIQTGLRNQGISVTMAVVAGAQTVTHNFGMPAGKFSSLIFRAYNAGGTEVVFKRVKASDTANVAGFSSVTAMAAITFDLVPLA